MSVEKQRVGAVSTQMKEMEPIVQSKQAVQFEHKKLCIEGLGENTSRDSLKYYVERISDTDVLEIEFGTRCNAIVTLDDELGTEGSGGNLLSFCFVIILPVSYVYIHLAGRCISFLLRVL